MTRIGDSSPTSRNRAAVTAADSTAGPQPGAATGGSAAQPTVQPGDSYSGSGAGTAIDHTGLTRHGGLPDVLMTTGHATVQHGTDPGDYYCEHMFFSAQRQAGAADSSVARNSSGEPLVGFLHVPRDRFEEGHGRYTQASRHAGTREVVGAALRGFHDAARASSAADPVRLLVTGYGSFGSVTNNTTGEFVSHRDNLDAAMREAFGDRLLSPEGVAEGAADSGGQTWRYRVMGEDGQAHDVLLRGQKFPVTDDAIDGAHPRSIQRVMQDFQPQAVLSMGVAGGAYYRAEFHADSGGLDLSGTPRHDYSAPGDVNLADNYALARAIHQGQQASHRPVSGLLGLLSRPAGDD